MFVCSKTIKAFHLCRLKAPLCLSFSLDSWIKLVTPNVRGAFDTDLSKLSKIQFKPFYSVIFFIFQLKQKKSFFFSTLKEYVLQKK